MQRDFTAAGTAAEVAITTFPFPPGNPELFEVWNFLDGFFAGGSALFISGTYSLFAETVLVEEFVD